MQKILLMMNTENPQLPCIDFAAFLARLSNSRLVGVFIRNTIYEDVPMMKTIGGTPYVEEITSGMLQTAAEKKVLQRSMQLFKDSCSRRMTDYAIHNDTGVAIHDAILESRFADYIITDASISFRKDKAEAIPSSFLKALLKQAECPVVVAPDNFEGINEIVFTYDGSKESVFAIRQFIYLFPELAEKKIVLLEIKTNSEDTSITNLGKIQELLMYHYSAVHYDLIYGENPKEELFKMLLGRQSTMLVMGAYGKQRWFGSSTADLLLEALNLAVFIAHQ